MEICDKRTRTALAPRSGGDVGAEKKTTLMLPSSAGMMRAFTSVLFSDMLIEFTRTYEGGGGLGGEVQCRGGWEVG